MSELLRRRIEETWGYALEEYHGGDIPSHEEVFTRVQRDLEAHLKERQYWAETGTLDGGLKLHEVSDYVDAFTTTTAEGTVSVSDFLTCLEELEREAT
jgi:hypothetical protein